MAREVSLEAEGDGGGLAVAVLGEVEVNLPCPAARCFIQVGPVQQDHQISILFHRAGLAEIRQLWAFVGALLRTAVQSETVQQSAPRAPW